MKPVKIRAWTVVDKKTGRPVRGCYEDVCFIIKSKEKAQYRCLTTEEPRRVTIIVEGKK